ncbi:MAG: sulfate adenylyltransferase subunit CysD [Epsilonproteobacteria bacterium]|nr:MAG: sulfate adenylyltransferase subunit CysD [Campylobacterota bacterium]RLA65138.1 MAG: sulfate adenylyltransferase subunit CysD [Campylobacterota bacterium]
MDYKVPYLKQLELEAIYIFREAVSQCENPALLFSGGKDSIVMVHLAKKAFWPGKIPFPLVHIDTGHNFEETLTFRDELVKLHGHNLVVGSVEESIKNGEAHEEVGPKASRNALQSITLMSTIENNKYDCLFGGARRDEEKARAKERFFSHRDAFGQWEPKNQRPELWSLYNGRKNPDEHFRVFPLSNWTELDVWEYIRSEGIEIPSLYFSHKREVFKREGVIYAHAPFMTLIEGETVERVSVRFRTIGDVTCTGAVESTASTLEEVINEIKASRVTERGTRIDDKRSEAAMEDRKKQGYF